jgi:imidazole glycerol-phosphate synthase subunit HisH
MIKIIDYGVGNIASFLYVYKRLNIAVEVARTEQDLQNATRLILPGVGSFDQAMSKLKESSMLDLVTSLVFQHEMPVIGICVGMQILANLSDEGLLPGLGWSPGKVRTLTDLSSDPDFALPHMGWNNVIFKDNHPLFSGLVTDARFYFLHSYYFDSANEESILAEVDYGQRFTCAVQHKNIFGVQFHPEKSHHYGAQLLKNFAEI